MRILFVVMAFLGLFKGPQPVESVNLLIVGEAVCGDAEMDHLQKIASAAGKTLVMGFAEDVSALPEGSWDAVVFSQRDSSLRQNVKAVRGSLGNRIAVYMAQTDMETSRKAAGSCGAKVLPDACAYGNLGKICKDEFAAMTEGNLTPVGCYTRACVWYEALFNTKVFGSRYGGSIKDEDRRCAQLSADAAIKKPFKICLK